MLRLYANNSVCQTKWIKHFCKKNLVCYASLNVLVQNDSVKKYVGESLNSISQWDFKPHSQIESNWGWPITTKNQSPVSGPICSHRASGQAIKHIDSKSFPSQHGTLTKCWFNVVNVIKTALGQFIVGVVSCNQFSHWYYCHQSVLYRLMLAYTWPSHTCALHSCMNL